MLQQQGFILCPKVITPRPPLSFGFATLGQATNDLIFALTSDPLQRQCFLALSMKSNTAIGILRLHIA